MPSKTQLVLAVVEGGLMNAVCAEPAIDALCRQSNAISLTVASVNADVFVGHPQVHGIMYIEADNQPDGFDRIVTIPAGPSEASAAERILHAAEALEVKLERIEPRIHLTSMDAIRTARLELGRPEQPVAALCLRQETDAESDCQRWKIICEMLEEQWNASIVLLSGQAGTAHIYKNLTGRLMPREAAAVLSRCAVWLGDDPEYAVLGWAVQTPGVFVSDKAVFQEDSGGGICSMFASPPEIMEALNRVRQKRKTLNVSP